MAAKKNGKLKLKKETLRDLSPGKDAKGGTLIVAQSLNCTVKTLAPPPTDGTVIKASNQLSCLCR